MKWIIVSIIALVLQHFLPWWSIAIAAFIFGLLIDQNPKLAFIHGFMGIFILWAGIALYVYFVNEGVLAQRLATMMGLPYGLLPVLITGISGGIVGGLFALSGRDLKFILYPRRANKQRE